jgi:hypothetical protein
MHILRGSLGDPNSSSGIILGGSRVFKQSPPVLLVASKNGLSLCDSYEDLSNWGNFLVC